LDLNSNLDVGQMSPREQQIYKKKIQLMQDSKYAAQIASYDKYVRQQLRSNQIGDSTIDSKTRSLF
jgi:hypothetical protein